MWICKQCGEKIEDQFDSCWKCASPKAGIPANAPENPNSGGADKKSWRLAYKYFRGTLATWDDLFDEAAQFATETGPERVAGLSHSADRGDGVVTVWYWTQTDESKDD
jgi:hypothetical protein